MYSSAGVKYSTAAIYTNTTQKMVKNTIKMILAKRFMNLAFFKMSLLSPLLSVLLSDSPSGPILWIKSLLLNKNHYKSIQYKISISRLNLHALIFRRQFSNTCSKDWVHPLLPFSLCNSNKYETPMWIPECWKRPIANSQSFCSKRFSVIPIWEIAIYWICPPNLYIKVSSYCLNCRLNCSNYKHGS